MISAALQEAIEFRLPAANGCSYSLSEALGDSNLLVLIFMALSCPYAQHYFGVLESLSTAFPSASFVLVNANSSTEEDDESMERMVQEYSNYPLRFLRDEHARLLEVFQATVTPEVFVLDRAGCVRFQGPIDDRYDDPSTFDPDNEDNGRWPWDGLREPSPAGSHLQAFLSDAEGGAVKAPTVISAIGCAIYREE